MKKTSLFLTIPVIFFMSQMAAHCGKCGIGDDKAPKACNCKNCKCNKKDNPGGAMVGVAAPRWTYAIAVKNDTKGDIKVQVDGGNVDGFITIAPGVEKELSSRGDMKKGVTWMVGDYKYETEKYSKPDHVVIHDGGKYDMAAMDKIVDKGTWTANEQNEYKGISAKAIKIK